MLEGAIEAMRRAGLEPVVDEQHRWARARADPDIDVEVGFENTFRVLGAFIDTIWTGRLGDPGEGGVELEYRFAWRGPGRFLVRSGGEAGQALGERLLADPEVRRLIRRAELKYLRVRDARGGRRVQVEPMAGTITAVYFPPLPPYTLPLRPSEADAQLALLLRLMTL